MCGYLFLRLVGKDPSSEKNKHDNCDEPSESPHRCHKNTEYNIRHTCHLTSSPFYYNC
ncbi:protein of unknown function [Candidatus Methylomirabilis oxygeniifera]|uniref:Uncharacterized protein n=1 Tax=Methylomirabilis oxygeniifera TaxID=671143 RepID=D5MJF2_METO1|nr:protein of unknown function [Candidatus Methylomirabilis oxyfera]